MTHFTHFCYSNRKADDTDDTDGRGFLQNGFVFVKGWRVPAFAASSALPLLSYVLCNITK